MRPFPPAEAEASVASSPAPPPAPVQCIGTEPVVAVPDPEPAQAGERRGDDADRRRGGMMMTAARPVGRAAVAVVGEFRDLIVLLVAEEVVAGPGPGHGEEEGKRERESAGNEPETPRALSL